MAKYDKETKFYWLQLKEDFFEEDAIEWLEEQEDGHKYSLFYLKLCLKSLKTNGVLIRNVGTMLIPYDNKKLSKLTNTDINTVIVAMELLKNIGLIQILENGEIYINQLENMIGSQSKSALKKQQQRLLKKNPLELPEGGQGVDKCPPKIEIEIEKDIEIEKEINKEKEETKVPSKKTTKKFIKPSVEEVNTYCKERNNSIDAEMFVDYYECNGWKVGKNPMKDWKAAVRTWERRNKTSSSKPIRTEIVPDWMKTEQKEIKPSLEEEKRMQEIINGYQPDPNLRERLKRKYGKKNEQ